MRVLEVRVPGKVVDGVEGGGLRGEGSRGAAARPDLPLPQVAGRKVRGLDSQASR